MRSRLRRNLALLAPVLDGRPDLFDWVPPDAGPITFPTLRPGAVGATTDGAESDRAVAERIRTEAGVLVIPGALFDAPVPALRLGFGRADFPDGLARFEAWLDRIPPVTQSDDRGAMTPSQP